MANSVKKRDDHLKVRTPYLTIIMDLQNGLRLLEIF
jgi:hypothetical protein